MLAKLERKWSYLFLNSIQLSLRFMTTSQDVKIAAWQNTEFPWHFGMRKPLNLLMSCCLIVVPTVSWSVLPDATKISIQLSSQKNTDTLICSLLNWDDVRFLQGEKMSGELHLQFYLVVLSKQCFKGLAIKNSWGLSHCIGSPLVTISYC